MAQCWRCSALLQQQGVTVLPSKGKQTGAMILDLSTGAPQIKKAEIQLTMLFNASGVGVPPMTVEPQALAAVRGSIHLQDLVTTHHNTVWLNLYIQLARSLLVVVVLVHDRFGKLTLVHLGPFDPGAPVYARGTRYLLMVNWFY